MPFSKESLQTKIHYFFFHWAIFIKKKKHLKIDLFCFTGFLCCPLIGLQSYRILIFVESNEKNQLPRAGLCKIFGSTFARIHNHSVGLLVAAKCILNPLLWFYRPALYSLDSSVFCWWE